ncbi:hypothetical protein [Streptomyces indicus]|uniref:Uncharacterized protein n=1 Tax=Streptomyces indicus TaxID=417292 RepID=A0A1G9ETK5_9ACTN|nr:hypothetical protein [Streptomyces indicus]SDK79423.1 hypothetical protein SAMN05421806_11253 [Streptomyces indicus]
MPFELAAIACLFALTLCYCLLCAVSPFGDCRRCRGLGFKTKTNRRGIVKRGKDCVRCKTTGKRIRVGRHLYNLWAATYRDGTR